MAMTKPLSKQVRFTQAGTGAVERLVSDKLKEWVSVKDFGAVGDGVTDDTAAFTALHAAYSGDVVDLGGKSYVVAAIPTGNFYQNGSFIVGGVSYRAASSRALLSSSGDTGGTDSAYSGGLLNLAPFSGRTTTDTYALLASQNSRASGPSRAVVVGSIYCESKGNVSGNYSSRQSLAWVPQSVNIGSEECWVWGGFRGGNYSSIFSGCENESNANLGSRSSIASGRNSVNIASAGAFAGRGGGARFTVTVSGGAITGVTINRAGARYQVGDALLFSDRTGPGAGAAAIVATIDGSGGITGITLTNGGSNYSNNVDATVDNGTGNFSANIATTNSCVTSGEASANIASNAQTTSGLRAASIASQSGTTSGQNAAQIASNTGTASGTQSCVIASNGSTASGVGSLVLAGNTSSSNLDGALVIGRRVAPEFVRSIVYGDSSSGGASTANRKFEVATNGQIRAAGTITGSVTFTDYAEYFENLSSGAIPLGTLVALGGRKVRPTHAGDDILGVVSATALVVAGDSPFTWSQRYLTGEFGELLMQDVECVDWVTDESHFSGTVAEAQRLGLMPPKEAKFYTERQPVENPNFDPERENIPRSQRPDEWTCVGLLGQVHVRVASDVAPGDFVAAGDGGVGVKSIAPTNMRCMEIRQAFDAGKGYAVAFCLVR